MSMSKNVWVFEVWNPVGDGDGWTPLFARAFNDWEIDLVEPFVAEDSCLRGGSSKSASKGSFLCLGGFLGNGGSSLTSLCQDAGPVEPSFLPFWCILDSFVYSEGNLSWMEWMVCGKRSKRAWQMAPLCIFWGSLVESHSSLVNCSINVDEILLLLSGIEGTPLVVLTQGDLEEVNNLSKSTPEVKSFGTGIEVKFFQVALCPNPCFQLRSTNCK
ncbi:hypothetical protein CK203_110799 [Vitis vinifera]|uniref:Uncharacterized protein n=1 Tax=Vitis vinifera TaxID=29760 RepID=A0A438FE76_VITVI|nr:hypothetical protein CK203_110799 [Vitis vinifera]